MIWFEFAVCLAVVLFAGTKLAQYGDVIAEKTGLGRIWIGVVLIAFVTTIPELVTSVSSVALVHSPNLALGTLLGSCAFNLAILALLDILHSRTPVLSVASPRHIAAAVVAAGIWLSFVGDDIGKVTGWGSTFVGNMFLAITTSAPELVVAITALRIGAIDLAAGDILGANMLDVAMILPVDLAQGRGFVLASASNGQLIVASVAVAMTLLVMAGLRFRRERKLFRVASWYTPLLIGLYVLGSYALFNSSSGL